MSLACVGSLDSQAFLCESVRLIDACMHASPVAMVITQRICQRIHSIIDDH